MNSDSSRSLVNYSPATRMKLEYNGRWIRFRLELFPAALKLRRTGPAARNLVLRRRLLRRLHENFQQTAIGLEQS